MVTTTGEPISPQEEDLQPEGTKTNSYSILERYQDFESNVIEHVPASSKLRHPKWFLRVTYVLIIACLLLFFVWILTTPYGFPWFIYPLYICGLADAIFFIWGTEGYFKSKWFAYHSAFFWLTSFMLILSNVYAHNGITGSTYPWAIYPIALLALFYEIHAIHTSFPKYFNIFVLHLLIFMNTNVVLFLTWAFLGMGFPWFLIVLVVWSCVLLAHWIIKHHADIFIGIFSKQHEEPQIITPPLDKESVLSSIEIRTEEEDEMKEVREEVNEMNEVREEEPQSPLQPTIQPTTIQYEVVQPTESRLHNEVSLKPPEDLLHNEQNSEIGSIEHQITNEQDMENFLNNEE